MVNWEIFIATIEVHPSLRCCGSFKVKWGAPFHYFFQTKKVNDKITMPIDKVLQEILNHFLDGELEGIRSVIINIIVT